MLNVRKRAWLAWQCILGELFCQRRWRWLTHCSWVQTSNGEYAAKAWGYPGKPPLTVEQSIKGVLEVVSRDETTMPSHLLTVIRSTKLLVTPRPGNSSPTMARSCLGEVRKGKRAPSQRLLWCIGTGVARR